MVTGVLRPLIDCRALTTDYSYFDKYFFNRDRAEAPKVTAKCVAFMSFL